MKRVVCIAVVAALILLLAACDKSASDAANTVLFYYIHNEFKYGETSAIITPTVVDVGGSTVTHQDLLEKYFNGPTNYDCISPFPAGITLEDLQIDNNKVQLLLSPHMATLSGSSLTVALACLTRTVVEMTDVETVQIRIQNNQIYGEDSLTLTRNSFVYWDDVESGIMN